jgi:crotonobetainyl-CoA:carnitine CoA-transferase CaiB-like acyl-CoA transferase
VRNRRSLVCELDELFARRSTGEWLAVLHAAGVPAGKIRGVGEALQAAGEATWRFDHPATGPLELVKAPFDLLTSALGPGEPPPLLGQHTAEVLAGIGVDEDRLAQLEQRGVIARPAAA